MQKRVQPRESLNVPRLEDYGETSFNPPAAICCGGRVFYFSLTPNSKGRGLGLKTTWNGCLGALLLLLSLSLASGAQTGAASRGHFILDDEIRLPLESSLSINAAAFMIDAPGLVGLVIKVGEGGSICLHERHFFEPSPGTTLRDPTRERRDCYDGPINVVADGSQEGWVALVSEGKLTVNPSGSFSPEHRTLSTIASPDRKVASVTSAPQEEEYYYHRRIEGSHLLFEMAGTFHHDAPGAMNLRGPSVLFSTSGRTIEFDTGDTTVSGPLGRERIIRWAFLEAPTLNFTATATSPAQLATRVPAGVRWDGAAAVTMRSGILQTPATEYQTSAASQHRVEGIFRGSMRPGKMAGEVVLEIQGEFHATTMAAAVPHPSAAAPLRWPLFLAATVGAGLAAAGSWGLLRLQQQRTVYSVDDCMAGIQIALEEAKDDPEFYKEALLWARRGRRMDPERASFAAEEGFCLARLGRISAALEAYEEAHELAEDGGPAYEAAIVAHEAGLPPEQVMAWVERALEKAPSDLEALEHDFPQVAALPAWESVRERVRTRQA